MTQDLFARLRAAVAAAKANAPHYVAALKGVDPQALRGAADLAGLPVLRKSDLIKAQEEAPPFGGVAAKPAGAMARLFLSPGPIAEPQGHDGDIWGLSLALKAAGFKAGEIAHNCFSYHLTPAGMMFDAAARTLGCAVFPGGVGATETQVAAMRRFAAAGYIGTPDFLKIILEKADELGTPVVSVKKALVTGGPLFPDLRKWYEARGIAVRQCYATADLGLIAYEDGAPGMAIDPDKIVEIVRPGTGDVVADGEVGEVVVTHFDEAYPLIRFATGDLSAVMTGADGSRRLKGWMGRADQTTKVRGMFVHPEQVARVVKAFPAIRRARLVVTETGGRDEMRLLCEADWALPLEEIAKAAQAELRLRADIEQAAPGALPNDGKVIEDKRKI